LLVTQHHIVSDGWSMGVLTTELSALYAGYQAYQRGERGALPTLPALPVQYADYAVWQRAWMTGDVLRAQAEYWRATLAGAPERLELPTDHARPAVQTYAGAVLEVELDAALTRGLKALSRRQGTTLFMTVLAGWAAVLARLSGQTDVVIGTPTANRGRAEIEGLIGFFVNTLALRLDMCGAPSGAEVMQRVKGQVLAAQQHQDVPFEQVVELVQPVRSLAHSPVFQVMLVWQNAPAGGLTLPGIAVDAVEAEVHTTTKFDLTLSLEERDGRIAGAMEYATALFERETMERHVGYLCQVLAALVADEQQRVETIALLSAAERAQVVVEWNQTAAAYPSEQCAHELFERQAARTPDAVAVVYEEAQLTYAALNARANQLAQYLRRDHGVGPEVRVALCLERSVELVVALLGVLKAGGVYVPLDPEYPAERLRFLLGDSAPRVLLTQTTLRKRLPESAATVVYLDAD
jgi:non-ribosomal peptide synthetase component F